MEDDDDFGDLYSDVLKPFESTITPQFQHPPVISQNQIDETLDAHSIDTQKGDSTSGVRVFESGDANSLFSDSKAAVIGGGHETLIDANSLFQPPAISQNLIEETLVNRTLDTRQEDSATDVKISKKDPLFSDSKGEGMGGCDEDVKFDIEEENTGLGDALFIPGLSTSDCGVGKSMSREEKIEDLASAEKDEIEIADGGGERGEGDDWDSDSEDDLQIVLNDNNHQGPMGMERGAMACGEEEEDGESLMIVAEGDQSMVEQEWGEDVTQAADGKEVGEPGKTGGGGGGAGTALKTGFGGNHGYHPYHSQFKYVRPGAAPVMGGSTAGSVGAPGQPRPTINMGPMAGRGRGDWRPPGVKGFHPGIGMPWGNNMGRGFTGGLDFTLPSHKTIFEVDIDGFEEKPWRYPGVDITDFFNFGLDEESWKGYCKQLEQHRLETTMQGKIHVYESGRTVQDYDPDLPPELAAATGVQDVLAENADFDQSDPGKGFARARPPLPAGRAIQVETGYGERLPSVDTRPSRIRDSDAIIEIVCQDTADDSSSGDDTAHQLNNDAPTRDHAADDGMEAVDGGDFNGCQDAHDRPKGERVDSADNNVPERVEVLTGLQEAPLQEHPRSRGPLSRYPRRNPGTPDDERRENSRLRKTPPPLASSQSVRDKKLLNNQVESVSGSIDSGQSQPLSSPAAVRESSIKHNDAVPDADGNSAMDDTTKKDEDENSLPVTKIHKTISPAESLALQEDEDSKTPRSSENSKAKSGSSKDNQKGRASVEEEVIQDRYHIRAASSRKRPETYEPNYRGKYSDGRQDLEKSRMGVKGRENSSSVRDFDRGLAHHSYMKTEEFDRRHELDVPDALWQRRDDNPYGRKGRAEDSRKRDRVDDMGSRHRGKIRESLRQEKEEYFRSSKQFENGSSRGYYDKDSGSQLKERDDNLKSRYDVMNQYPNKRNKDEEYLRRDHPDKEEMLYGQRESSTNRRKQDRDDTLDTRKRNFDDRHSIRHKDEVWLQRDRGERQKERGSEWNTLKQSPEEILPKRERGRTAVLSRHGSEDRGLGRAKDEYKGSDKEYHVKDIVRSSEHRKRRDRIDDRSSSHRGHEEAYVRENHIGNDDRKSRVTRFSSRNDVDVSDSHRVEEKKHKENIKKNKDPEESNGNTLALSRAGQPGQNAHVEEMGLRGATGQGNSNGDLGRPSKRIKEDASSDDEQPDSRRGRSKLERWTSNTERDYSIATKSSAPFKLQQIDENNDVRSTEPIKLPKETAEALDPSGSQQQISEEKGAGQESAGDGHLNTVERLKKRSERFKIPLPADKDVVTINRTESEALPSAKSEAPANTEIKAERPARKRRWISS